MVYNKELAAKHDEILNDIKKNLADITKDDNLEIKEAVMAFGLLQQEKSRGKFEYIFEKGHVSMQIKMSKVALVQMINEIAESIFKDKYELISMLLAYSLINDVIDSQTDKRKLEEVTIDCNGKTQAEIDLMKEMLKKSPEELAKLKEQMDE